MFVVIWAAATLNFLLPKLSPKNPIEDILAQRAEGGGQVTDIRALVTAYEAKFGLNLSLGEQYLNYVKSLVRLDLGSSITFYPTSVLDLILRALPWTIGLLLTSTLISFTLGTTMGAVVAWRGSPTWVRAVAPAFMVLAALPYYLLGLVLVYLFAFTIRWFPMQGGYSLMAFPGWDWEFVSDVLYHSILPAASIVLTSIGSWALVMRGMMVTIQGEDYMTYARANGLGPNRRFFSYGLRNALLPQLTMLALHLGHIAAGAVIVERIFAYPGLGMLLFQAIESSDYFVIYGVVLIIIVMVAVAMLLVDILSPLLDPRIKS
jgi:peptide/nickel transport system permease protein